MADVEGQPATAAAAAALAATYPQFAGVAAQAITGALIEVTDVIAVGGGFQTRIVSRQRIFTFPDGTTVPLAEDPSFTPEAPAAAIPDPTLLGDADSSNPAAAVADDQTTTVIG